jgi:hypothetical protein
VELFWLFVGAVGASLVFWFRSTKAQMRRMAAAEFVSFLSALQKWRDARDDFDSSMRALHWFEVFNTRYSDFLADPTGRSLPSDRAILAHGFVTHMRDTGLVRYDWRPLHDGGSASDFWEAVETLQAIRSDLLQQESLLDAATPALPSKPETSQDRERDRARLVSLMNQSAPVK